VVLFKGNNRIQALFMQQAQRGGHRTASIDEESFVSSSATEIGAQYHALAEAHCDLFLTQGAFQRRVVLQRFPTAADRIVVTGNPRADLLRDARFRPVDPIVEEYRAAAGPYLLLNTNFTSINPKLGDAYSYYQTCLRVGVLDDPEMPPFKRFMTWCRWERENLRAMTKLIRRLSEQDRDRRIVIRPHPSERADVWAEQMSGIPGVDVRAEGDHLAWIDRADILVHSGCSTGLEAYLLGRPAISLTPGDKWWPTPALSNIVNPVAATVEQAEELLQRPASAATEENSGAASNLDDYLFRLSDPPAATRIAGLLSELSKNMEDRPHAASAIVGSSASRRMVDKAFISLDETRRRLDLAAAAIGTGMVPRVTEIAPSVFQIGGDTAVVAQVVT
jgi:surface carbohydrate biosynthesis protein